MSSGLGKRQRDLLAALADTTYSPGHGETDPEKFVVLPVLSFLAVPEHRPLSENTAALVMLLTQFRPEASVASANRRALLSLVDRGLVERYYHPETIRFGAAGVRVWDWVAINDAGLVVASRYPPAERPPLRERPRLVVV